MKTLDEIRDKLKELDQEMTDLWKDFILRSSQEGRKSEVTTDDRMAIRVRIKDGMHSKNFIAGKEYSLTKHPKYDGIYQCIVSGSLIKEDAFDVITFPADEYPPDPRRWVKCNTTKYPDLSMGQKYNVFGSNEYSYVLLNDKNQYQAAEKHDFSPAGGGIDVSVLNKFFGWCVSEGIAEGEFKEVMDKYEEYLRHQVLRRHFGYH